MTSDTLVLSVDAMGGDHAPGSVLGALEQFAQQKLPVKILLHGDEAKLSPVVSANSDVAAICEIRHTDKFVAMDAKPSQALKRRAGTSMNNALESVRDGEASVAVSAGNTGALMAMSTFVLKRIPGVHRPALAASWPNPKGACIVLDVGANIDADAEQLVEFAIMGSAYARAIHGKDNPRIALLNIGSEDLKGIDSVRAAAELLKSNNVGLNYTGFVEGNDISLGGADVIVTDGYTGNIALKTAEGTAKLVKGFVDEALRSTLLSKAGALLALPSLKKLRDKMDPGKVNGGVFLGVNGIVLKSHGGADASGFATTLQLAYSVGKSSFIEDVEKSLSQFQAGSSDVQETVGS